MPSSIASCRVRRGGVGAEAKSDFWKARCRWPNRVLFLGEAFCAWRVSFGTIEPVCRERR